MSWPYAEQPRLVHNISVGDLSVGQPYQVLQYEKVKSKYKKRGLDVMKLVATFQDGQVMYSTFLPTNFDDAEDKDVAIMNNHIAVGLPSTICYYGKVRNLNVVYIHPFGTSPDFELLRQMTSTKGKGCYMKKMKGSRALRATRSAGTERTSPAPAPYFQPTSNLSGTPPACPPNFYAPVEENITFPPDLFPPYNLDDLNMLFSRKAVGDYFDIFAE